MADGDGECVFVDDGVCVSELAGEVYAGVNSGECFDEVFADESGVEAGATGDDLDVVDIFDEFFVKNFKVFL